MRRWGVALAVLVATACATPQQPYQRRGIPPDELVVEQHEVGPIVVQAGRVIPIRDDVDELRAIVSCVPEAAAFADGADNVLMVSTAIRYASYVVVLSAIGMAVVGITQDDRTLLAGAGVVAPVGIVIGYFDDIPKPIAVTRSIDAVNAYNDRYFTDCQGRERPRPKSAPRPKPNPAPTPAPKAVPEEPGGPRG